MNDNKEKKNSITREYPQSLYPRAVIEQAVRDYDHICQIELQAVPQGTICCFYDSSATLMMTVQEFSNYLIELINKRVKRGTACLS